MVTEIIYDTEFLDDGSTIAPISVAFISPSDGAELYAISDDISVIARAAENAWMRDNVLRWLPVDIDWRPTYGALTAFCSWDPDHPDYRRVKTLEEIRDMVEDFVLERKDPQLWAYYGAYDHVLYAQLFGPMVDLPNGMPMYTMDLKHETVMRGDPQLPPLSDEIVNARFGGTRMEHHALYDAYEEGYRMNWLMRNHPRPNGV